MKKSFTLSVFFLLFSVATFSQIVDIPNAAFKTYLLENTEINTNGDGEIQSSEAMAFSGTINCIGLNVSDFTGIEEFVNLTVFYTSDNMFASGIDLSQNTALEEIRITSTNLSSLDLSQNGALETLEISNNSSMQSIDLSTCPNLKYFYCAGCTLMALDLTSNVNLVSLSCNNNALTDLDLSTNTALELLNVNDNGLQELDVSNCSDLLAIACTNNILSSLDLSFNPALSQIICVANVLTSLNLSNISTSAFLNATENPNLSCIQVDDVAAAELAWTSIDATSSFSTNCNSTSTDEVEGSLSVSFYPNPAHSEIFVVSDLKVEKMYISDALGAILIENIVVNESVDLSDLPRGFYYLHLITQGYKISQKLILE